MASPSSSYKETQATTSTGQSVVDKELEELLEVFGSQFSLGEIASAYARAKADVAIAADILCSALANGSSSVTAQDVPFMSLYSGQEFTGSTENALQEVFKVEKSGKELKTKKSLASMGMISGVTGKDYAKWQPLENSSGEATKPVKLDSKEFPVSETCGEKNPPTVAQRTQADVEEFLFKMLGDGFQLDAVVIREVLGVCGYDLHKSVDKLLDLSNPSLEKYDDSDHMPAKEAAEKTSELESFSHQEQMQQAMSDQSTDETNLKARNPKVTMTRKEKRAGLEKQILASLFNAPDRTEEVPTLKRIPRSYTRSRKAYKISSVKPPKDVIEEQKQHAAEPAVIAEGLEEDESSYEVTRKAVKEYRATMRAYYKAAVDAHLEGDQARENKLLAQAKFFKQRAQEAEEESHRRLMEVESKEDEVLSLNMNGLSPAEALRLLKVHLASLSGIPTVKYLRVNLADNEKDRGAQKKLIIKRLDEEFIKWSENGQIMLIQLDVIEPERLSFTKKDSKRGTNPSIYPFSPY